MYSSIKVELEASAQPKNQGADGPAKISQLLIDTLESHGQCGA